MPAEIDPTRHKDSVKTPFRSIQTLASGPRAVALFASLPGRAPPVDSTTKLSISAGSVIVALAASALTCRIHASAPLLEPDLAGGLAKEPRRLAIGCVDGLVPAHLRPPVRKRLEHWRDILGAVLDRPGGEIRAEPVRRAQRILGQRLAAIVIDDPAPSLPADPVRQ
jgi:hypothetical protein